MPLTDTAIRKAKPADKPQKLRDGNGLYLLLQPDGARWWCYDYRRPITGKRNTISFGTYPEVSLADPPNRKPRVSPGVFFLPPLRPAQRQGQAIQATGTWNSTRLRPPRLAA